MRNTITTHEENSTPEWLVALSNFIFDEVSLVRSKKWPLEFSMAIINTRDVRDLNKIKTPYTVYILEQNIKYLDSLLLPDGFEDIKMAILQTKNAIIDAINAHMTGHDMSIAGSAARAAQSAIISAADVLPFTTNRAVLSATESTYFAAISAIESVGHDSRSVVAAVSQSARSGRWSFDNSLASYIEKSSDGRDVYERYSDELLRLIKECK